MNNQGKYRWLGIIIAVVVLTIRSQLFADATPLGTSYMLCDNWGGTWTDAEKTPQNTEDDLMCWAAAASNALEWTEWGKVGGMITSDDMFAYFQNHWTDEGGLMQFGWDWWFDGSNNSQGWSGWSQVDITGGGFYPNDSFLSYYRRESSDSNIMRAIDISLHDGYMVTLGLYGPGGHAITCWGFNYSPDDPSDYYGIWITDSDDSKYYLNPPNLLRYYNVEYNLIEGKWYMQNYGGSSSWYIGEMESLTRLPSPLMGDADHDWDVDDADLNLLLANFGLKTGATWEQGDFDGDEDVDDGDLNLLLSGFGTVLTLPVPEPDTIVPEPITISLLLGGVLVIIAHRTTNSTRK